MLVRVQNWEAVCPGGSLAILVSQDVCGLDRVKWEEGVWRVNPGKGPREGVSE